ncbi:TPA: ABC transporter ATP-binding protein [Pseudomonas aeruginosa]|nr:ABC transporter ATP-binding protein [Pseudomonas aeruginosa]
MTTFPNAGPVLEIRGAVKHYRTPEGQQVRALDGIDLSINQNEFVTLLGPSGCGKTSLLRTISGFETLDSGELLIQGRPMNDVPPNRRPVHTVFQNYALFPHLTVGDNVGYGLDIIKTERRERDRRVAAALEQVGMSGLERRKPGQLSGGQQQRVALARALVNRPALLLLDEPLSALDKNLRQSMQRELKNLQSDLGIAFVFVTHDQEEALTLSDRIVVLNGGKIQQIGGPTEIYDRPATSFVATFIGESNLFQGTLSASPGGNLALQDQSGEQVILRASPELNSGQAIQVLLRPEQFQLQKPACDCASLRGVVEQTVFIGKDVEISLRTAHGNRVKALVRDHERHIFQTILTGTSLDLWYALHAPHAIYPRQEVVCSR